MAMSCVYTNFGGMLVEENRGGTIRDYLTDPLGSLVGEIDNTQTITYSAEYWPYGEVRTTSGSQRSSWGFVGLLGYLRDLTNLLYVRARYYQPGVARWLTSVSLAEVFSEEQRYGYAGNKPVDSTDQMGLKPGKPSLGQRLRACKSKRPKKACFDCAYFLLHARHQWSPERACNYANAMCGSHVVCGPCGAGSGGFPKAPGCSDGISKVREFLDFLHGKSGQESCGGHQGFDKLAHCYANCMAALCGGGWGILYCRYQESSENDPEDVTANELGRRIAFQYNVWNGQACFDECAKAVYGLESW